MYIWIRVPLRAMKAAISALKTLSMRQHDLARIEHDTRRKEALRIAADESDADAEGIKEAVRRAESGEDVR